MLSWIGIRNFRALEEIHLRLAPLTALIGPNGAGKSSILRAIDIVEGSSFPSLRSFRIPQDFTDRDETREIAIQIVFEKPYVHRDRVGDTHQVRALRVVCKPYVRKTKQAEVGDLHVEVLPRGANGKPPIVAVDAEKGKKAIYRPLTVSREMRDHGRVLFIDQRRTVAQHMPWMRGSPLAELLAGARKELRDQHSSGNTVQEVFRDRYQAVMDVLRTPKVREVEEVISETTRRTLGFLGASAVEDIDVGFGFADPANPLASLRLIYREAGVQIPSEELGLGVQSALVVGVFEALRRVGGNFGTILIEEPEMYLHPQAQRYFHSLLRELAESGAAQVIYSTHSPVFADVAHFESIRLVRRESGKGATLSMVSDQEDRNYLVERRQGQKLLGFTTASSEVFFARRALMVEGRGDALAARLAIEKLELGDVDAEDFSIIECGGKGDISFVARLCVALDIPFVVLHDEDIREVPAGDAGAAAKRRRDNEAEEKNNQRIAEAVKEASLFVACPSLEEELGIGRDARDKPSKIATAISERSADDLPDCLSRAVRALFDRRE